jgi:hypothetical protein
VLVTVAMASRSVGPSVCVERRESQCAAVEAPATSAASNGDVSAERKIVRLLLDARPTRMVAGV